MIRTVLSVLLGYIVMVIVAMLGIVIAWNVIGPTGAFKDGTPTASTSWCATALVFGLVAAVIAGFVTSKVGHHPTNLPVKALAGLVLALGLLLAVAQLYKDVEPLPEGKTVETLTFAEAGDVAISPTWYNFTIPLVGALGALLGGGVLSRRSGS